MPGSIRNSESDMDVESQGAGRGGAKKRKGSGGGGDNGDESLASKGRRMEEDEFKVLMRIFLMRIYLNMTFPIQCV